MTDEQFSFRRLYEQLAERIRHRSPNGKMSPIDNSPAEHILAQDCRVRGAVVRETVKTLKQDGPVGVKAGHGAGVDATDQALVQSLHLLLSPNLNEKMADIVELRELEPTATQERPAMETRIYEQD